MKYITILMTFLLVLTMTGCEKEESNLKDTADVTQPGKSDGENTEEPSSPTAKPTKEPTSAPTATPQGSNESEPFVPENPDAMPIVDDEDITTGSNKPANDVKDDWYQTMLTNAQMNVGNNLRLKEIIKKAQAGEKITIGAIGGSITEGAGATRYQECYAYQTYQKFKDEYGSEDGKNVSFVNAGVGGTPSTFGIMRYERDIVSRVTDPDALPDIVLLEYAVNDYAEPTKHACYESLVKYILEQPNNPVVILVFAVFPDGFTLQNELKKVGKTYDLMMVSTKDAVFPYIDKQWTSKEFFYDIYHPTTLGHAVMADCIINTIKTAAEKETSPEDIKLDVPAAYGTQYVCLKTIFKDSYEEDINLSLGSFSENDPRAYANHPIGKVYDQNFYHTSGTESLTFTANCKNLLLAYRAVNDATFGAIDIYVDGAKVKTINGNTGSWGQSVTELIFSNPSSEEHFIEIKMAEGSENKKFTITCMGYTE